MFTFENLGLKILGLYSLGFQIFGFQVLDLACTFWCVMKDSGFAANTGNTLSRLMIFKKRIDGVYFCNVMHTGNKTKNDVTRKQDLLRIKDTKYAYIVFKNY